MRVLHLPITIGGTPWGLAQGEKLLGLDSEVLTVFDNSFRYPADRVLFNKAPKNIAVAPMYLPRVLREVMRIRGNYDVFHFNFGTTPLDLWMIGLPLLDLPFYRGKIVVTYNGCDARQKDVNKSRLPFSPCHNDECYRGVCVSGRHDKLNRQKIRTFDKYASHIFAVSPDLKHFLPERATFLPVCIANWDEIEVVPRREPGEKLTLLHAPTDRGAKGSETVIEVCSKLQERYPDRVRLVLVENMSHAEAIKAYRQADLIIDQILIGWYGGFAVEAMKMGIPVVAYINQNDLKFVPGQMAEDLQSAVINADPFTLHDILARIIEDPSLLQKHREAGLDYVHKWHNPLYLAGLTKAAYEG